jgi:hypothetical protein
VFEAVEQHSGGDLRSAGIQARSELLEQLGFAQPAVGVALGAPHEVSSVTSAFSSYPAMIPGVTEDFNMDRFLWRGYYAARNYAWFGG